MAKQLWTRRLVWIVPAAVALLAVAGLLLRDVVVTAAAARALERLGLRCVPISAHLPLALPPSSLGLDPTRCEVGEGPIQSIEFKGPLEAHLDGLRVDSLATAALEVDMRPRVQREVELDALGDLARIVGLDRAALDLMFDLSELSLDGNPPLRATHLVILRAGKRVMQLHDFRTTFSGEGVTVSSPRVSAETAALLGEGALLIKATPTAAVATVAFPGTLNLRIVLDHIDAARPKARFDIVPGSAAPAR